MRTINYFNACISLLIVSIMAVSTAAAPGDLDTTFGQSGKFRIGFGRGLDAGNAVVVQSDSKIVVAGTAGDGSALMLCVVRYNPDGTRDTSFGVGGRAEMRIPFFQKAAGIRLQPDGKIVVGVQTLFDIGVARFNADGSSDNTLDGDGLVTTDISGNSEDIAAGIVLQGDNKIIVVGSVATTTAPRHFAVLRYNVNGTLDTTFDSDGKVITTIRNLGEEATAVTLQDDNRIVVAGYSRRQVAASTVTDFVVLRYQTNGSLDLTFNTEGFATIQMFGGDASPNSVVFQKGSGTQGNPDKIVVAGNAISGGNGGFGIIRLTIAGLLDTTFSSDGRALFFNTSGALAGAMMTEGTTAAAHKIVVAGRTNSGNFTVARINSDGNSLDTTFSSDGISTLSAAGSINSIAAQNGRTVIAGVFNTASTSDTDFAIGQFISGNGSIDPTFDGDGLKTDDVGNGGSAAKGFAMLPDGRFVMTGNGKVVRCAANGTLETGFGSSGVVTFASGFETNAVAVQSDGKTVIAGTTNFTLMVARLNLNGTFDTTFDGDGIATTPIQANGYAVAVQTDGKIVAAGNAGPNFVAVRLNTNGSPDTTFDGDGIAVTPFGSTAIAQSIALQPDGKIVLAGFATLNAGATQDFAVARYNTNGILDTSFAGDGLVTATFGSGTDEASAVAIQPDGKILVAGYAFNGTNEDFAIVRFDPNGIPDSGFDGDGKILMPVQSANDRATAIAVQSNGKILVAGRSESPQSLDDFAVVRYNQDGSLDTSFSDSAALYGNGGKVLIDFFSTRDSAFGIALDSLGRPVVSGDGAGNFAAIRLIGDNAAGARAPFDFDGDGKTDISIYRPSVGQWWYQNSSTLTVAATTFGQSSDRIVPGDYTGDGKTDIAFFRPSNGQWFVLRSEDFSFYSVPFGTNGDIPVPGDHDGDGKTDVAVFRPSTATWFVSKSSGGTDIFGFGTSGDQPVVADYDGDGKADVAIYRPGVGEWWVKRSSNQTVFALSFGTSTDKPVQGDFTGDGKADIAFWRPSNGNWYILRSEDFSFFSFPFGATGDVPAPGDFDGDGRFDPAVFRPSGSTWFINRSTAGILIANFGATGDNPVPNAFVP